MRTPAITGAILATSAIMAGNTSGMPYNIPSSPCAAKIVARGRVGGNQRQQRKDKRRAHAAGKRNAFA